MTTLNKDLSAIQLSQAIEQLNNLSTDELVNLYIEYASDISCETIYNLDESTINKLYTSPWQALYDSNHKDFNDRDYFFTYNGNGHMVSFSNEDDSNCPIDISELAQWLISEDKLAEYAITVTTLEDILASIEDNISDDNNKLDRLFEYLNIPMYYQCFDGRDTDKVSEAMNEINNYSYEQLNKLVTDLNINYE